MNYLKIYIQISKEKKIELEASYDDTFKDIKLLIEKKEGIPFNNQVLFYKDKELENNKSIDYYNIDYNTTIQLVLRSDKVSIKTSKGKLFTIEIRPKDLIINIKEKIKIKEGFLPENQNLFLEKKELEDKMPISHYNIKNGSEILLIIKSIKFYVNIPTGVILNFNSKPSTSIIDIKKEIKQSQEIDIDIQQLIFNEKILEDAKTIDDYDIRDESIIKLKFSLKNDIQLFVKTFQSKVLVLDVNKTDTIGDIKDKIQDKNGIPKYNQRIIISGKELEDKKTLNDYGLDNNSTIHLVLKDNKNECILLYKINKEDKNIRIIGENFYKNNSIHCKIIINGKESKLYEFYEIKNNESDNLIVKLIKNENLTDMSFMFCGCTSLLNIDNISKWDTKKVTKMNSMFSGCESLIILPDISNWDTSNVVGMNYMFSGCISLTQLPDISKWNIKNVINMRGIFSQCKSLISLPDISKWDTSKVTDMSFMFCECISLSTLPDLSQWNVTNVIYMAKMFEKCLSLLYVPDISKWDISNVTSMVYMFSECTSLTSFPDISSWDLKNVIDTRFMFSGCKIDFLEESKNKLKQFILRNEDLKFLPQIELKFNDVKSITEKLISDLKQEIKNIINEDNFSIIEIKKGSLQVLLTLQFIIFNEIQKLDTPNKEKETFDYFKFFDKFSETIRIEVQKLVKVLLESDFISMGMVKPSYVGKNIFDIKNNRNYPFILKKLNESRIETNSSILEEKFDNEKFFNTSNDYNDLNIVEISKNISIDDLKDFYNELALKANKQEINQKKLINKLDEFNLIFDKEIEKAIKESIFEYKITQIYLTDRDLSDYLKEKENCENTIVKFLFHGTTIKCAKSILSTQFRDSKCHAFGKGVYFTDMLDYTWRYSKDNEYLKEIPKIGDSFSIVVSEIYYNNNMFETVYDTEKRNLEVPKYGIRHGFGNFKGEKNYEKKLKDSHRFIGNEFLITDKNQILPLYCITFKRIEYLVIWRDNNFIKNNPNKYSNKIFNKIQEFHRIFQKKITLELNSKIYYLTNSEDALNLIKKKKYNKIIIITNGSNDAKKFIIEAREILGEKGKYPIIGVSVYDIKKHYKWIKEMENTILLNGIEYHEKFLNAVVRKDIKLLGDLRNEIINEYKKSIKDFSLKELNQYCLEFPNYKKEGSFNNLEI